jgi:two-component system chemotaxis response regulator CheY
MRILVVEDSRVTRQAVMNMLQEMGHAAEELHDAADGAEALEWLEETEAGVDLVLTDWIMPNLSGLQLLRRMKSEPRWSKIPVIFLTGVTQRERVLEAVREGARAVLVKPFTAEQLGERIRAVKEEKDGTVVRRSPAGRLKRALSQATRPYDAATPFFAQLPGEIQQAFRSRAESAKFAPGQTMLEFHQVVGTLNVIESGEVELLATAGGKPMEVRRVGECVGECSFLSGDSVAMVAKARIGTTLLTLDPIGFIAVLEEHPAFGVWLTRLLVRQSERERARVWPRMVTALAGQLGQVSLGEVAQMLVGETKTGLLQIAPPGAPGELYFEDGEVRHASAGGRIGEDAFFTLLGRTEGSFTFQAGKREVPKENLRETAALLAEGIRRLEEARKAPPPGTATPSPGG